MLQYNKKRNFSTTISISISPYFLKALYTVYYKLKQHYCITVCAERMFSAGEISVLVMEPDFSNIITVIKRKYHAH